MEHDESTLKPKRRQGAAASRQVPALTILCHPEIPRIGERALLLPLSAGRDVPLCRNAPDFRPPDALWQSQGLGDPFLSRRPLILRPLGRDVLELHQQDSPIDVTVNGAPLAGSRTLHRSELLDGTVLELADRVALLLHLVPEDTGPGSSEDHGLVGRSAALHQVRTSLERVADIEVPVLLRGDSGTGKELVARALHRLSSRSGGPFIAVNLGAIPPSLASAELFGNVKGAFTGAVASREGYFRAADGGTLFLDEVGEAPLEVQVMLLRALETGEVFPVGSQRPRRVNMRLVAATDSDLEARVGNGSFRAPLLHRLSAYEIRLPPLRRRREDVGLLFVHFALQELRALGESSPPEVSPSEGSPWISAGLIARLARYGWPGNVRQLKNVVRQLVIDSRGEPQLRSGPRVERLLAESTDETPPRLEQAPAKALRRRPGEISEEKLEAALREHSFELAKCARHLGISRPSLYNLIRRHPRLRTAEDVPEKEIRHALDLSEGDAATAAQSLEVSVRALARRVRRLGLQA